MLTPIPTAATSEGGLASAATCYGGDFPIEGGGFALDAFSNGVGTIDDLTLKMDRDANGSYETTELVERFTLDGDGYAQETPEYDAAGNLTYDGVFQYSYDAWNRQTKVTKAYRDDAGNIQLGSVVQENEYDGVGRRIVVSITNSGDLDRTEHTYYDGWSEVETRNGSNITTTQRVWAGRAGGYIDELLQLAHNLDWPDALPTLDNDCEARYWVAQDANYNVQGVLDASGALVERYEYEPYGARRVYVSAGSNDPKAMVGIEESQRVTMSDAAVGAHGLNPFGHQGLMHDDVSGLVNNRRRMLQITLARFGQRDRERYVDASDLYVYVAANPQASADPSGDLLIFFRGGSSKRQNGGIERFRDIAHKRDMFLGNARVYRNGEVEAAARWVESHYRDKGGADGCVLKEPLAIVGYSWGGPAAVSLAKKLSKVVIGDHAIEILYLATVDPIGKFNGVAQFEVPQNVRIAVNYYQRRDRFFKGERLIGGNAVFNLDWSNQRIKGDRIDHFNIPEGAFPEILGHLAQFPEIYQK